MASGTRVGETGDKTGNKTGGTLGDKAGRIFKRVLPRLLALALISAQLSTAGASVHGPIEREPAATAPATNGPTAPEQGPARSPASTELAEAIRRDPEIAARLGFWLEIETLDVAIEALDRGQASAAWLQSRFPFLPMGPERGPYLELASESLVFLAALRKVSGMYPGPFFNSPELAAYLERQLERNPQILRAIEAETVARVNVKTVIWARQAPTVELQAERVAQAHAALESASAKLRTIRAEAGARAAGAYLRFTTTATEGMARDVGVWSYRIAKGVALTTAGVVMVFVPATEAFYGLRVGISGYVVDPDDMRAALVGLRNDAEARRAAMDRLDARARERALRP